jgi:hypothetical protein
MLGVALAYGGIAQIRAGMWEFRKQRLRRHGLHLVRRLLAVVLGLYHLLRRKGPGGTPREGGRLVPDRMGGLHYAHADRRIADDRGARPPVRGRGGCAVPSCSRSVGPQLQFDQDWGSAGRPRRGLCLVFVSSRRRRVNIRQADSAQPATVPTPASLGMEHEVRSLPRSQSPCPVPARHPSEQSVLRNGTQSAHGTSESMPAPKGRSTTAALAHGREVGMTSRERRVLAGAGTATGRCRGSLEDTPPPQPAAVTREAVRRRGIAPADV